MTSRSEFSRASTTSLRASCLYEVELISTLPVSIMRSSRTYLPEMSLSIILSILLTTTSLMKPTTPRFTPITGTSVPTRAWDTRSIVPSPPITITASTPSRDARITSVESPATNRTVAPFSRSFFSISLETCSPSSLISFAIIRKLFNPFILLNQYIYLFEYIYLSRVVWLSSTNCLIVFL